MTCPSCSRPTRDYTNSSGLVTRCDDAWHARKRWLLRPSLATIRIGLADYTPVIAPGWVSGDMLAALEAQHPERLTDAEPVVVNAPPAHSDPSTPSPATPGDFVRPGPAQAVGQKSTWHENSPRDLLDPQTYKRSGYNDTTCPTCPTCGHGEHRSATCIGGCDCATGLRPPSWPFDPHPPKLIPADNGFRFCDGCDSVVEARGHECRDALPMLKGVISTRQPFSWLVEAAAQQERAEFAESVLCATVFAHSLDDHWRGSPPFRPCGCFLCDAARGGGR